MKKFICLCLLSSPFISHADTIYVDKAWMQRPVLLEKPFETDSLNMKGKAYDIQEVFKMNTDLVSYVSADKQEIARNSPLFLSSIADSSAYYLTTLKFTVSTDRFAKTNIQIRNMKNHKTFVGGKELTGTEIQLLPGYTAHPFMPHPTGRQRFIRCRIDWGTYRRSANESCRKETLYDGSHDAGRPLQQCVAVAFGKISHYSLLRYEKRRKQSFPDNSYRNRFRKSRHAPQRISCVALDAFARHLIL